LIEARYTVTGSSSPVENALSPRYKNKICILSSDEIAGIYPYSFWFFFGPLAFVLDLSFAREGTKYGLSFLRRKNIPPQEGKT
jgi:hypothetical protein